LGSELGKGTFTLWKVVFTSGKRKFELQKRPPTCKRASILGPPNLEKEPQQFAKENPNFKKGPS
jgi:hypothetical protein